MIKWIIAIIAIFYSFLRYAWAQEIPVENWPAFVMNKATAFCAVSFLVFGLWQKSKNTHQSKEFLHIALVCAITHAFMSAALLNPHYYQFLFSNTGHFNIFGEFTLLFGACTIALFLTTSKETITSKREIFILCILILHIVSVGILKWLDYSRWKYGLIPISLISATIVSYGIFHKITKSDTEN